MSLEDTIIKNTEAVLRLTEITAALLAAREDITGTIKAGVQKIEESAKPKATAKKAEEKPATAQQISETPEDRKEPEAEAEAEAADTRAEVDGVKNTVKQFMADAIGEKDRAARKAKLEGGFAKFGIKILKGADGKAGPTADDATWLKFGQGLAKIVAEWTPIEEAAAETADAW